MKVMGVLLAAGGGLRFRDSGDSSSHKLLVEVAGRPLWRHSLDHLLAARLDEVVVVTGAAVIEPHGVTVVHNPDWASGQASSLRVAVAAAMRSEVDAIVVGL